MSLFAIDKRSYKERNRLLLVGFVLLLLLGWFLAFSKTYHLWKEHKTLSKMMTQNSRGPERISMLRHTLDSLNLSLQGRSKVGVSSQDAQLDYITTYVQAHGMKVSFIPGQSNRKQKGYDIDTRIFQIDGNFKSALQLIYELEQHQQMSRVVSAKYTRVVDRQTKAVSLISTIYLENIHKGNDHEKTN
jgi:hypothetical protein